MIEVPALYELMRLIRTEIAAREHAAPEALWQQIEHTIRTRYAAQRIYVPPLDSRKDPARAARVKEAARHLPTRVVADRLGVSESWVRRVGKKGTNRDT